MSSIQIDKISGGIVKITIQCTPNRLHQILRLLILPT